MSRTAVPLPKTVFINQDVKDQINDVPDVRIEDLNNWLSDLYDVSKISPESIKDMWEAFSYKGFNKEDVLKQLFVKIKDKKIIYELILVGALRGPQAASKIKLSNGKTAIELGIPASGGQGTKKLTMNRIVSATADLAAWFLKKMNAPKRTMSDLPAWLQFPSAGAIKMPEVYRQLHIDFSKKFSEIIGGAFNEGIYSQMVFNSYLNPKLQLFSEV
jgi:hypothetical protein